LHREPFKGSKFNDMEKLYRVQAINWTLCMYMRLLKNGMNMGKTLRGNQVVGSSKQGIINEELLIPHRN
jgi:hypothetical protein